MKLQKYEQNQVIPGVKFIQLKVHKDDGGQFTELYRASTLDCKEGCKGLHDSLWSDNRFGKPEEVQVNCSKLHPGTIKAFHLHKEQTDIFYTPDKLLINLIDCRPFHEKNLDGVNLGVLPRMRFIIDNTTQVVIPPGVAHGVGNPYKEDATLIYFVDKHFNKMDEWRITWNVVGAEVWDILPG